MLAAAACGGDGEEPASPTLSHTPSPERSATATATGEVEFDAARAMQHVRALAVDIGTRAAGTDGEKQAAAYIRDQLAGYGYRAELQPFPFETFADVNSTLDVLTPESRGVEAAALGASASGGFEGEIVEAGLGRPQEFPVGTSGKAALVQRGEIFFSDKVANAAAAGAAAVIIYNNEPGILTGQLQRQSDIPALSISEEDGQALATLLEGAPVSVRLDVRTETTTAESQNVVAEPPSGSCRAVVGGHYDSVPAGPGANDNASGTGVVIEIARVLASDGDLDDVCFALFGSEEIGLVGSAHYVDVLTPQERGALKGMLNFDMLSVGEGWPLSGSPEIVDIAAAEAERLGLDFRLPNDIGRVGGSDHTSFIQASIPGILFNCFCDPRYHTANDRFEFVEQERVAEAGALGLAVLASLLAG